MHKPSRILVIGAGASLAEAEMLKIPKALYPPLISNFAKSLWSKCNPHPILDMFLESEGCDVQDRDGREIFYDLEAKQLTNVERFFEFAWRHRNKNWAPRKSLNSRDPDGLPKDYIHGFHVNAVGTNAISIGAGKSLQPWENLIHHGIGFPLQLLLIKGFSRNGSGYKPLNVARAVASKLRPGDVVLNLNYDPLFEIGLNQAGIRFQYAVSDLAKNAINVLKPHGTLNMAVSEDGNRCTYGPPEDLAAPPTKGWRSLQGIIPPRFNKVYTEHPLARSIISTLKRLEPTIVTFWGVGLAISDKDMLDLYRGWVRGTQFAEVINPKKEVVEKFRTSLYSEMEHFISHESWLSKAE